MGPLWQSLVAQQSEQVPALAGAPARTPEESWARRRPEYERLLGERCNAVLLAELDGRPVGYAFLRYDGPHQSWDTSGVVGVVESLAVLPEARGRGVGSALLDRAEDEFRAAGARQYEITATSANEGAHRLYARRGMSEGFVTFVGEL